MSRCQHFPPQPNCHCVGDGRAHVDEVGPAWWPRRVSRLVAHCTVVRVARYNNYAEDPLSLGDPVLGSVCARGDLQKSDPVAFGCVDSKVTTATQTSATVHAVSGPTHVQQPVFVFDPKFENVVHTGVENVWDFDWTTFEAQA